MFLPIQGFHPRYHDKKSKQTVKTIISNEVTIIRIENISLDKDQILNETINAGISVSLNIGFFILSTYSYFQYM